jgi:hypothetical protein
MIRLAAVAGLVLLLAACQDGAQVPPNTKLPPLPADLRTCFVGVVEIPKGALTVGQVEALWKQERVRSIAMQRCGKRLIAWVDDLRSGWK